MSSGNESIEELINQMGPKRNPDEIDINKKISSSEKFKSSMKETEIDYYKILGVSSTATPLEIKRAYQSKLKKFNPNKLEQTKENKEKYNLLREAGDVLTNAHERKAYDMQRSVDNSLKDFKSQKESFKDFIKLQEQDMTDENKAIAKLHFERGLADMDRKHGYNKKDTDAMTKDEYDRRMEDLTYLRKQEDIEFTPDNIFKGREFIAAEFNKMFEKQKRKDEKRKSKGGITKFTDSGISAFNDFDGGSGGIGINQYDNLYSDGNFVDYNDNYAGIGSGLIGGSVGVGGQSDDDISIDSPDENEYDNHNKGNTKENLDAAIKKMMAARNDQDDLFDKMTTDDYGSVLDDKYGISKQFGFVVGTDKFGHQKNIGRKIIKEDSLKAYKELTEK